MYKIKFKWDKTIRNIIESWESIKKLVFVMVKCGVLFEERTEFLNNI
jgi:hypothetical protein